MRFLILAFKNLSRKKIRSFLTVSGVAAAVAVLVSLVGFNTGYQQGLTRDIDRMGYQVLVTAKGCPYEAATLMLKGGAGLRYMEMAVYEKILKDPRVDKLTAYLMQTVHAQDADKGSVLYMGIEPSFMELKPWMKYRFGNWFSSPSAREVIMGYEVAELEQRVAGDKILVSGIEGPFTVAGVLERTGTQDDGVIFMPLVTAQEIFKQPKQLTGVGIKLKDIRQISAFEESLYNEPGIQVVSLSQVKGTILNLVASAQVMVNSVAFIAVFIAVIGVLNTILMSVFERTQEIGVLKAMGASFMDVFRMVWAETVLICVFGGLAGNALALAAGGAVEFGIKRFLPYAPQGKLVLIHPGLLLWALCAAVAIGLVAGLYPAMRAAMMSPVEAIRKGVE